MKTISLASRCQSFFLTCLLLAAASAIGLAQSATDPATDPAATGKYDPVADSRAMVTLGHARFTVLTPQMVRMEWAADGKFEDRASFVFIQRKLPVPAFAHTPDAQGLTLKTAALQLRYTPAPASDGKFTPDNLSVTFLLNGQPITWHPGMADSGNLLGTTRTLDGAKGDQTREPIEPGLISRDGWAVVDDSARPRFDSTDFSFSKGEASPWPWVVLPGPGERQDWYFFGYGHDYKQALHDYVEVAGRIPVPPRFAFGAWWSRYWAYSDQELEDLAHSFRSNDVPLDVMVIDMDWHPTFGAHWWDNALDQSGHSVGWTGYSWNKLLFPDPEQFLKRIHEDGLKTTLNLHPASGVQPWEDRYPEMARAMGIDPATKKYVAFDITNKKFATNYLNIMHHPLEKQGIDFWWLDWQQEGKTGLQGVSPTWWLNYVHFTDQQRQGKRPLLFHRWGGLGNHRYQIGFSGDSVSVWESLAFQPWFTATAANVGYAYWSHDLGGHMPGNVEPELYTRWLQFGAFSPIFRTHTTKNSESERRIWAYPEPYADILRGVYHLRYAMQPYLYTEARRTYDTGVAFLHPLYYDWPEANDAYSARNEYTFGVNLLVAPVTKPVDAASQLAAESVWIPDGEWIEWGTGRHLTGPATLERKFSIRQIPVYVRAGAIVPMQPEMPYTGAKPVDPLILNVFPMAEGRQSSYTLYEDSSSNNAYTQGQAAWTELKAAQRGDVLTVEIAPVRGDYPGMLKSRGYEVRLPGDWPPAAVTANGVPLRFVTRTEQPGWCYEGNTLTTVIRVAETAVNRPVRIDIRRKAGLAARRGELDGFAGAMTRLRETYDTLNFTWPISWSPEAVIDAMQSGDRLSYHPETAESEITHFHEVSRGAVVQIKGLADKANQEDMKAMMKAVGGADDWQSKVVQERVAKYKQALERAMAQAQDAVPDSAGR